MLVTYKRTWHKDDQISPFAKVPLILKSVLKGEVPEPCPRLQLVEGKASGGGGVANHCISPLPFRKAGPGLAGFEGGDTAHPV